MAAQRIHCCRVVGYNMTTRRPALPATTWLVAAGRHFCVFISVWTRSLGPGSTRSTWHRPWKWSSSLRSSRLFYEERGAARVPGSITCLTNYPARFVVEPRQARRPGPPARSLRSLGWNRFAPFYYICLASLGCYHDTHGLSVEQPPSTTLRLSPAAYCLSREDSRPIEGTPILGGGGSYPPSLSRPGLINMAIPKIPGYMHEQRRDS